MKENLLCVILAAPRHAGDVSDLMRMLRAMRDAADSLLLFCDLSDAFSSVLPEDDALIRSLQSGVMSLASRMPGRFLLLVRSRTWDDDARSYLGESQPIRPHAVIAGLMASGHALSAFSAASFSPASLAGRFSSVLFLPASVACAPDVPRRMLSALGECGMLRARVQPPLLDDEPLLTRLSAHGFSLSSPYAAAADFLARRNLSMDFDQPLLCSAQTLAALSQSRPFICPLWEKTAFVRRRFPTFREEERSLERLLSSACRSPLPSHPDDTLPKWIRFLSPLILIMPLLRMLLVFLSAAIGWELPALLAFIEPYALLHPRLLPDALVRLSLLPVCAVRSFNALFAHWLARSPLIRIRFPSGAKSPTACAVCAVALIPAAFFSLHALAPLFALALLWLCAPLLVRSLDLPARERIPLSDKEHRRLLVLAQEAFSLSGSRAQPGSAMLAACAGCMLGFLEPDEAARRVQSLCADLPPLQNAPDEQACALTAAQFLREHMGSCDAALRELPAQIEAACMSATDCDASKSCSRKPSVRNSTNNEKKRDKPTLISMLLERDSAHAALFLPLRLAHSVCPATHPHAFLRGTLPESSAESDGAWTFLFLCDAALGHPFMPIFWRSPLVMPAWAEMTLRTPSD